VSWLGLALIAEGPTDYRFLPPLLYRLTEDLCLRHGLVTIEVDPVRALDLDRGFRGDRTRQIVEAARQADGSYHILFLHTDGAGDPVAAIKERFEPWCRGLAGLARPDERAVAVVPVREMEAWALCDGGALRGAFGTTLPDEQLGLPRTADVEGVQDPKKALETAYERAFRPRKPKRPVVAALEAIAERVELDHLRQLPAFRRLEDDLRDALRDLRYVR
jgi:hypothetical protein